MPKAASSSSSSGAGGNHGMQGQRRGLKRGRPTADVEEEDEEDEDEDEDDDAAVTQKQIKDVQRSISSLTRLVKAVISQRQTPSSAESTPQSSLVPLATVESTAKAARVRQFVFLYSRARPDLVFFNVQNQVSGQKTKAFAASSILRVYLCIL